MRLQDAADNPKTRARAARTVLIIDDSDALRQQMGHALTASGLFNRVLEAADGIRGFKLLVDNPVDLILCDLVMPSFDGFKFLSLKHTRAEYNEVPVIMITGEATVHAKLRGFAAGASDYLTKPLHDEELIARVRVHMKVKQLQDELRVKNERLEELSRTDELTGLSNRRYFMELLGLEFLRAQRYGHPIAFAMADLDRFKAINDSHGHPFGDRVLRAAATALNETMRLHDLVGRLGGEEFGILLPHTAMEGALIAVERCRQRIARVLLSPSRDKSAVTVTASLGLVAYPRRGIESLDDLVAAADKALYEAKEQGRNRVVTG